MTPNMTDLLVLMGTRGLYRRVAKKLGVDPSSVSRVARGERRNGAIEKALGVEVNKIQAVVRKSRSKPATK